MIHKPWMIAEETHTMIENWFGSCDQREALLTLIKETATNKGVVEIVSSTLCGDDRTGLKSYFANTSCHE